MRRWAAEVEVTVEAGVVEAGKKAAAVAGVVVAEAVLAGVEAAAEGAAAAEVEVEELCPAAVQAAPQYLWKSSGKVPGPFRTRTP
jgi:hypothetical protein